MCDSLFIIDFMRNPYTFSNRFIAMMMLFAASTANATTISFTEIVNDGGPNLSGQLSATISEVMSGAEFKFYNDIGANSSITSVFFDVGTAGISGVTFNANNSSNGVDFKTINNPTLPEGNTLPTSFDADFGLTKNGANANGINESGEYASFLVAFNAGFEFEQLTAAITSGLFRIGLHVTSIALEPNTLGGPAADGSDGYINNANVSVVPVPAAAWLFGSALLALVVGRRRKLSENTYKI